MKKFNNNTKDFIYKSNSWKEFFNALKNVESETKGDAFELLCFCYLSTDRIYRNLLNKVWHESDCPNEIYTKKLHLLRPEIGVDLICEDINGKYWAVQCKYRFPETDNLKYDEVSSFFDVTERSKTKKHLSNRLLITTTLDLSERINQVHDDFNCINYGRLSDLEKEDFDNFRNFLDDNFKPADKKNRFKPKPHQREAINNIKKDLVRNNRSQAIMACGSGKTLVALWVKEELEYEQVLVLVPSLNLASQIIKEWFRHKKIDFDAICICSDKSVTKRDKDEDYDNWVNSNSEIEIPVKNQINEIRYFLKTDKNKVIFCTYQSSPLIAEAMLEKDIRSFDVTFCDEAHRVAGAHSKTFSLILDEKKIRSNKRLFLTATPKETDDLIKETAKAKDREIHSMDDEKKFGKRSHVLSFRDALHKYKEPILCDYRIIACEIYRSEVNKTYEQIIKRDFLSTDGQNIIDAETLATQIAIIKAIKAYNLKRIITFHNKRENAYDFSKKLPEVYKWLNDDPNEIDLVCDYIDGEMSTYERKEKLKKLKSNESENTILFSNARCLQEGVDIKNLDGIAFIEPKKSFIDIIQAVGRVMRINPGKKYGTILIPVFLEDSDNIDKKILESRYSQIWRIAKALSRHDEYLLEKITELRISLGKRKKYTKRRGGLIIDDKIIIAERVKKLFSESIELIIAKNIIENWYEKYGELLQYVEDYGDAKVRIDHPTLGTWVDTQRQNYRKKRISKKRIKLLEKLIPKGWVWNTYEDRPDRYLSLLEEFLEDNGHLVIRDDDKKYGNIAEIVRQIYRKDPNSKLYKSTFNRLEELSDYWMWEPFIEVPLEKIRFLKQWSLENNSVNPKKGVIHEGSPKTFNHRSNTTKFDLGVFADNLRSKYRLKKFRNDPEYKEVFGEEYRKTRDISQAEIDETEKIEGWYWDIWEGKARVYQKCSNQGLSLNTSLIAPTGMDLPELLRVGRWISQMRGMALKNQLKTHMIILIESLPEWTYEPDHDAFMKGVEEYIKFTSKKEEKDIPQKTVLQNGFKLGQWVSKTRTKKKKGKLSSNKLYNVFYEKILSNHGFIWQSENLLIGKTSSNNK